MNATNLAIAVSQSLFFRTGNIYSSFGAMENSKEVTYLLIVHYPEIFTKESSIHSKSQVEKKKFFPFFSNSFFLKKKCS